MNKIFICLVIILLFSNSYGFSQKSSDSLIYYSDLRFNSKFEKDAFHNFIQQNKDSLLIFLVINEDIKPMDYVSNLKTFKNFLGEIKEKGVLNKKMNKRIKETYALVHEKFLKKYNNIEFFASIFQTGTYNCVSASILYALFFDRLNIPYKIMASSNHVYLVANPGENSEVIETTNPLFENQIFSGEFKRQYVNYLKNSKMISEAELQSKSTEEIFESHYNQVTEANFNNLIGFQYFNKALLDLEQNNLKKALYDCQKAYYFFPSERVSVVMYNILIELNYNSSFNRPFNAGTLALLTRFKNITADHINAVFLNYIDERMQYTETESECDSTFNSLISNIKNAEIRSEVEFSYYSQMSWKAVKNDRKFYYKEKAISLKPNHQYSIAQFKNELQDQLNSISDFQELLDTLPYYEKTYNYDFVKDLTKTYKLVAYLKAVNFYYSKSRIKEGEKYLKLF